MKLPVQPNKIWGKFCLVFYLVPFSDSILFIIKIFSQSSVIALSLTYEFLNPGSAGIASLLHVDVLPAHRRLFRLQADPGGLGVRAASLHHRSRHPRHLHRQHRHRPLCHQGFQRGEQGQEN